MLVTLLKRNLSKMFSWESGEILHINIFIKYLKTTHSTQCEKGRVRFLQSGNIRFKTIATISFFTVPCI